MLKWKRVHAVFWLSDIVGFYCWFWRSDTYGRCISPSYHLFLSCCYVSANCTTWSCYLWTSHIISDKGIVTCFFPVFVCLSVCLLARLLKNANRQTDRQTNTGKKHEFGWNVACWQMLGHGHENWLTFESNPDHSPDAGTGLLSLISYRLRNFAAFPRLPASCGAARNFMSGKSHVYVLMARR